MIIYMVAIAWILGILLNFSFSFYKKSKNHTGTFGECKIYSKFADAEIPVDDVDFKLIPGFILDK